MEGRKDKVCVTPFYYIQSCDIICVYKSMRSTHAHICIPMIWLSKQLSLHALLGIYSYDIPMGEL